LAFAGLAAYVVHGRVSVSPVATKAGAASCRGSPLREVFEISAGGLRIEGKVGDAQKIIPAWADFRSTSSKGANFEPSDKAAPSFQAAQTKRA